ncbi:MAG: VWA domain-containing protein [Leptospirales bacterium]|nr:VWA domain-containing protein [Leptospirales bacterium]
MNYIRLLLIPFALLLGMCSGSQEGLRRDELAKPDRSTTTATTTPVHPSQRLRVEKDAEQASGVTSNDAKQGPYLRHEADRPLDQRYNPNFNTEGYSRIEDNPFLDVKQNALSTFSIDVDTASYSNVRRFLNSGHLPPKDAVRIEEMINYFSYNYASPTGEHPFSVSMEKGVAPWNPEHELVLIGLQAQKVEAKDMPPRNLVFLLDVSGSMDEPNKLPLLKRSLTLLADQLNEKDHVAIVVYAGAAGLVLEPTPGNNKARIKGALEELMAGGSTNGGQGIELAYATAKKHFRKDGINRVILATDGDFNVGTTDEGSLTRLIEEKRKDGVYLTVLGFGMGNLKDSTMEKLADKGNGNYAYIDTFAEARKVLVEQAGGTLITVAKDVKIQVEFNPAQVSAYRLIGYENRLLRNEDFNDDKKDAGEIGAGHSVTALYEIVRVGKSVPTSSVDPLRYQKPGNTETAFNGELMNVKLRYKKPDSETSILLNKTLATEASAATENLRWASGVAMFGMVLRDSPHKGNANFASAYEQARQALGSDPNGYRSEMLRLLRQGEGLGR